MELVFGLLLVAFIAGVTAATLEHVVWRLHRRQQRLAMAGARPCTKIWAMMVPLHVARYLVGSQAVGCFQPAALTATCKANGSGSPTD